MKIVSSSHRHPASALLLAFFMMTMLILVAISVSILVLRDTAAVRTIVGGTEALYAAEGMTELGLYSVKENLPGYEPTYDLMTFTNDTEASAVLASRGTVVPCEGQDEDGWGRLAPNESVQLALFAQMDAEGNTLKNTSFTVDFYVGDEDGESLYSLMTDFLDSQDVLRWKILGLYYGQTEAISEYIPVDAPNRTTRDVYSFFGPGIDGTVTDEGYLWGKYYDSGYPSHFYANYPISTFLEGHDYNYLVLTNIIQGGEEAYIYYRLNWSLVNSEAVDRDLGEVVCEYTEINSVADSVQGDARQELQTLVREGENLPVYDFVLYHTEE